MSDSAGHRRRRIRWWRALISLITGLALIASACGGAGETDESGSEAAESRAPSDESGSDAATSGGETDESGSDAATSGGETDESGSDAATSGGETDESGSDAATSGGEADDEAVRDEIHFVSQNILHGIGCSAESGFCDLDARVELFGSQLHETGCPQMVSLQEANAEVLAAFEAHPPDCGYTIVWDDDEGLDRELVLTTLDVIGSRRLRLAGRFRSAYLVRVSSPVGVIDFVTAHLASSDNRACDAETCPSPCDAGDELRVCQARQVVDWARDLAVAGGIVVLGGDLNAEVGHGAIDLILADGFVDSHLAAGLDECDPESGRNCTGGRESTSLADMSDPASIQRRRIDYLFYDLSGRDCVIGGRTGLFNAEPAAGDLAFASDHTGVSLVLECRADADLADLPVAALPAEPADSAGPSSGEPDPTTAAAITNAYETLFDGTVADLDLRLAHLENADQLRDVFVAQVAAAGALASGTSVRVETISLVSDDDADVVYTILVLGSAVFERIEGTAIRADGRWLVSQVTFCDLALQDPSNVPEACG